MTQHKRWRTTAVLQERATQLRQEQTPAEQKLWARLRRKQLYGLKFRRQHPIGRFVVDFCCVSQALVVEVDGDSHSIARGIRSGAHGVAGRIAATGSSALPTGRWSISLARCWTRSRGRVG